MSTLLYDRDCGICRTILGWILMRDSERRITPVALQDSAAAALLPEMSEQERLASFHLVDEDGTIRSGGRALPSVFALLPGWSWVEALLRWVQPLTDAGYRLVAGNRDRIGRLVPGSWKRRADATIAGRAQG